MKVLLSLSVLCATVVLCQTYCFRVGPKTEIRNGVFVTQENCIDPFDGRKHPLGSQWNTNHCLRCECDGEMECCSRYGGVVLAGEGCKAVVNPETCEYEMYRIDNPSEPCV